MWKYKWAAVAQSNLKPVQETQPDYSSKMFWIRIMFWFLTLCHRIPSGFMKTPSLCAQVNSFVSRCLWTVTHTLLYISLQIPCVSLVSWRSVRCRSYLTCLDLFRATAGSLLELHTGQECEHTCPSYTLTRLLYYDRWHSEYSILNVLYIMELIFFFIMDI